MVGCGNISTVYLKNLATYPHLKVVACADLDMERAKAQAERFNVPQALTGRGSAGRPADRVVVNLTVPAAHATVGLAALRAGKSIYNEKPLAINREDGKLMLQEARDRGLRVGCAPDTFLGGGLQTCRALLDEGVIGTPVAATAFVLGHGPEAWHPDPDFFYKVGAGPMFDVGPLLPDRPHHHARAGTAGDGLDPDQLRRAHNRQRAEARHQD